MVVIDRQLFRGKKGDHAATFVGRHHLLRAGGGARLSEFRHQYGQPPEMRRAVREAIASRRRARCYARRPFSIPAIPTSSSRSGQ
jgi:hypothetical protein